jgi:hypothetical protein
MKYIQEISMGMVLVTLLSCGKLMGAANQVPESEQAPDSPTFQKIKKDRDDNIKSLNDLINVTTNLKQKMVFQETIKDSQKKIEDLTFTLRVSIMVRDGRANKIQNELNDAKSNLTFCSNEIIGDSSFGLEKTAQLKDVVTALESWIGKTQASVNDSVKTLVDSNVLTKDEQDLCSSKDYSTLLDNLNAKLKKAQKSTQPIQELSFLDPLAQEYVNYVNTNLVPIFQKYYNNKTADPTAKQADYKQAIDAYYVACDKLTKLMDFWYDEFFGKIIEKTYESNAYKGIKTTKDVISKICQDNAVQGSDIKRAYYIVKRMEKIAYPDAAGEDPNQDSDQGSSNPT